MTDELFQSMLKYEKELQNEGIYIIGGVDEAGRGPLAGPVVAACVVFDSRKPFPRANDSKKLSEKKREELYDEIIDKCLCYGIGDADNTVIDEVNILNATYIAMKNAIEKCAEHIPGILLVDHVHIPNIDIFQKSITHGDALSVSIASASIIAKVTRDRLMKEYDKTYPGYGFAKHKGYGTKAHYEALNTHGMTDIHRKSFLKS